MSQRVNSHLQKPNGMSKEQWNKTLIQMAMMAIKNARVDMDSKEGKEIMDYYKAGMEK